MDANEAELEKQLKKVTKLCKNEKCDINPRTLFDTSLCPGNMLSWSMIFAGFTFWIFKISPDEPESKFVMWLIYSCDGEGVEDQSIFDLEKGITKNQM